MAVRIATQADLGAWIALRGALWPDTPPDAHRREAADILARSPRHCVAFLQDARDGPYGFAEAALRRDHVNGCKSSPVGFLEGIYVRPEDQGRGIGRQLVQAVQGWALERGCTELASDADLANTASHAFHRSVGFAETERVVFFCQPLRRAT